MSDGTMDGSYSGSPLSPEAVEAFSRDGVTCLRGAISGEWIGRLREGMERNLREPGPYTRGYTADGKPGRFFGDYCNWQRIAEYRDFFMESGAGALAAELMRSRSARIFHEHVLIKEPGTEERTPWHHDQPYYCVDGDQVVSFWIPLDPVPREICAEFVAGSHAWGRWFRPTKFVGVDYEHDDERMEKTPDIEAARSDYDIRSWAVEPGDLIAFHFLTLHGAPANPSKGRRRAFAARFLGDDAVYAQRGGEVSPPFPEIVGKLKQGDPLPETLFPVIYDRPERERVEA